MITRARHRKLHATQTSKSMRCSSNRECSAALAWQPQEEHIQPALRSRATKGLFVHNLRKLFFLLVLDGSASSLTIGKVANATNTCSAGFMAKFKVRANSGFQPGRHKC
mmetsp:Transcript_42857/g.99247  ORF Transcript_42857/g.99247 Transcript_42857/m.99247 type:complete len:109 (+) Transcript_42857:70-396(+)